MVKRTLPLIVIFVLLAAVGFIGNNNRISAEQKNLSVTATVPAQPTDFETETTSSTTTSPLPQNTNVSYQVSYGSTLGYSTPITLVAKWDLGTISGQSSPTVDLLTYVIGSATDGYGSVTPVVDTVNRKITWTFNSFPGNTTNQTVQFQLRTNPNYTGSSTVTFPVLSRILGPGTQTPDSTLTKTYKYQGSPITPTPTNGPTPTSAPNTTPTPTPTPTTVSTPLVFNSVSVQTITSTQATIFISTSEDAALTVRYGKSLKALTQTIKTAGTVSQQTVSLDGLTPNTSYYFAVSATDQDGNSIQSDTFTLKTAIVSTAPEINPASLIISSGDFVLHNGGGSPLISIPENLPYSFQFSIPNDGLVNRVQTVLRDKFVLGAQDDEEDTANSLSSDAVQVRPGVYSARLKTPEKTGYYELYIRITDLNGNITENKLAEIKVSNRFTVRDRSTGNPVEAARVLFSTYNQKTKKYTVFRPESLNGRNPDYTDMNGQLATALPNGQYKAHISAIGYTEQTAVFRIGKDEGQVPPIVYLAPQPASLVTTLAYYGGVAGDFFNLTRSYIKNISVSVRFFQFIAVATTAIFVALSLAALSLRLGVAPWSMPYYLYYHLRFHYIAPDKNGVLRGSLKNKDDSPIPNADIYIINPHNNVIMSRTATDSKGEFRIMKIRDEHLKILFMKDGYHPAVKYHSLLDHNINEKFDVVLSQKDNPISLLAWVMNLQRQFLNLSFEGLLALSILLEIALAYYFSLPKALPFIIISLANVVLWGFHLHFNRKSIAVT